MKIIKAIFDFILLIILYGSILLAQSSNTFVSIGPYGASVIDMVSDPGNKNIIYAGMTADYPKQEIYKSTDRGNTWSLISNISAAIYSMKIDPNNSNILYVGSEGCVYKSTDGGISWEAKTIGTSIYTWCHDLTINKNNSNIIFGYYIYNRPGSLEDLDNEIMFIKSIDWGENWSVSQIKKTRRRYSGGEWAVDASDNQKLYLASCYLIGNVYHPVLFRSSDGGNTWEELEIGIRISGITIDNNGDLLVGSSGAGIYRSTDSGDNWTKLTDCPENIYSIECIRDNSQVIVGTGENYIYITTDGGTSWRTSGLTQRRPSVIINSATEIIIGNDSGIFKTENGGGSWAKKFSAGSAKKEIETIVKSKSNPDIFYCIAHGNTYKSTDGGSSWNRLSNSLGDVFVIDENSLEILYCWRAGGSSHSVGKSTDGGLTCRTLKSFSGGYESRSRNIGLKGSTFWVSYYDEVNKQTILLGSSDGGATWLEKMIAPAETKESYIAPDPLNDNVIYVSAQVREDPYYKPCIWKTTDGGTSWFACQPTVSGSIYSILIDPSNNNIIYFGGSGGVFKSTDGGFQWNNVSSLQSIALSIDSKGVLYSAYYYALQVSKDGGDTWETYTQGLKGQINFDCIAINEIENIVYVGTLYDGIFALDLNAPTNIHYNTEQTVKTCKLFNNYPNPFNPETVIRFQVSGIREQVLGGTRVTLEIYNILGQLVTTLVNEEKQPGEYTVFWNGKNMKGYEMPSGVYFYRLRTGNFIDVKKMLLIR